MRIIAGKLGGRNFNSPAGHKTHPMSDKMRGALFNALGDIDGLTLLDAFAGSGALSFEAISRGAARVVAIDADRNAQHTIKENINKLGLDAQIKLVGASASAWLSTTDDQFDIVCCDPPYDDVQPKLLEQLAARTKIGGLTIVSAPPATKLELSDDYELVSSKDYGDASLRFYRRRR